MSHANARLTVHGRRILIDRVIGDGRPVAHVAKEMGISRQCAHRRVKRFLADGEAGLHDRSSRPRTCPRRTPARVEREVLRVRGEQRRGQDWIGAELGIPAHTVSVILRRHQVPYLRDCEPLTGEVIKASKATAVRYERPAAAAGDLVHIDVKKVGRIPDGGGWKAHGRGPRPNDKRGVGYDFVHAAVDDHSRLAYAEILPDEKGTTCAGFLLGAAAFFAGHGITIREILNDNAKNAIRSAAFADAVPLPR